MPGRLACCRERLLSPSLGSKQPAPYYKNHGRDPLNAPEEICTHTHGAAYNTVPALTMKQHSHKFQLYAERYDHQCAYLSSQSDIQCFI